MFNIVNISGEVDPAAVRNMLQALFFLVSRMATEQSFKSSKDALVLLKVETQSKALYGDLDLKQRIKIEIANLHSCIIDSVRANR